MILFALIRAIAMAIAVAIAFGLHLPNADWMPIACLIAMKSSLAQSTLVAMQRLAGATIGAAVAAAFLLTVDTKIVLEVVIVILGTLAGSIRAVNYAFYCAALAGAVLIADDLPHPTNLADEGRRVLFTFAGVGIAVIVMLLAGLLQKRTAKAAPQAAAHGRPGRMSGPGGRDVTQPYASPLAWPPSVIRGGAMTGERYQDLPPAKRRRLILGRWCALC